MHKALVQNVSHEKVRLFGEAFAKIQEATGEQDQLSMLSILHAPGMAHQTAGSAAALLHSCMPADQIAALWIKSTSASVLK